MAPHSQSALPLRIQAPPFGRVSPSRAGAGGDCRGKLHSDPKYQTYFVALQFSEISASNRLGARFGLCLGKAIAESGSWHFWA